MNIQIKEVVSRKDLQQFIRFPFELFRGCEHWVPPISAAEMAIFDKRKNPVYEHSEAILFTAWKDGKIVGRIAGIINNMENDFINDHHARFGWLDFIDDNAVSAALIEAVEKWAKDKEMILLKGPHGFNQLDKNGMLTEGFDSTGPASTLYNYPYYPEHLKAMGYTPDLEWLEIDMKMPHKIPERLQRVSESVKQRYGLTVRQPQSTNEMIELGHQMFELLMTTYQHLPGFVPISKKQQTHYIHQYIKYLRKDFTAIVYDTDNSPIAFGVTLPSMSMAFKKAKGKLFPFGIFHILGARKKNDTADLALVGVLEEWRRKGTHGLVFAESCKAVIAAGVKRIQITPMQEFNTNVLSLWKDFEQQVYKKRKTFKKVIS